MIKKEFKNFTMKKYFFLVKMGTINLGYFLLNMSPARLMIKIWEFSEHVHHTPHPDASSCNCTEYLDICIDTVREIWDNENYIYLDTALYMFQYHRKKYLCLMSSKNEAYKKQIVESILRQER